jgi:agmatinase
MRARLSFMRRKYTKTLKGADAVVWGIPFDAAVSNRPGARFGPQAIRRASAIFDNDPQYPFARDLFEAMAVIDYGDCLLDYGNHQKTPATIEREASKILKSGAFLLSLGGDHFVTWPLLKAHAAIHGRWPWSSSMPIRTPGSTMAGDRPRLLCRPRGA